MKPITCRRIHYLTKANLDSPTEGLLSFLVIPYIIDLGSNEIEIPPVWYSDGPLWKIDELKVMGLSGNHDGWMAKSVATNRVTRFGPCMLVRPIIFTTPEPNTSSYCLLSHDKSTPITSVFQTPGRLYIYEIKRRKLNYLFPFKCGDNFHQDITYFPLVSQEDCVDLWTSYEEVGK